MELTTQHFGVPASGADLFASLPDKAQGLVRKRLRAMRIMRGLAEKKSVNHAARAVAAMFHGERGWSAETLNALYPKYIDSGDWMVLVDKSLAGPKWYKNQERDNVSDATIDWFASEWALDQRGKFKAVYARALCRLDQWRRDALTLKHASKIRQSEFAIPGYDAPPAPVADNGAPAGWHYSNLKRLVNARASKYSRKLIQIGPKAAANIGPKILSTRAGLRVGQYYIFDDSWNDFKVVAQGQTCRLLSFHALDLFSGCNVMRGYKPALRDEREIEQRLKEREMIFLTTTMLTGIGYHQSGCTLIMEKATATLRDREEEILAQHCPEIKVERGPRGGGTGIAGLFTGPSGGNPRWKAPLESWFNLLRNRTANMLQFPAQTGSYSSGLPMPEGLPGLDHDTRALMEASLALPQERAALLQLHMLTAEEATRALDAVTEVMCNCRIDHALEGWRECGHIIQEWRRHKSLAWQPAAALLQYKNGEALALADHLAHHPELRRERALSPREVFDGGQRELTKLPLAVGALLMGDLSGDERPVKQNVIEVNCPEVDRDEPLRFGLTRRDGRGTEESLRDDEKYLVRVNPLDTRFAWLYNADGSFAGVADFYGRVSRDDPKAITAAYARKQKALAPLVAEARRLAAPLTRAAKDRAANNEHQFTADAKARASKLKNFNGSTDDLLDNAPVTESAEEDFSAEGLL
jgi:hypothetical protein